jgi:hypothetical protein
MTKKGTKFFVQIITYSNQSLLIPSNNMTLTKFTGEEFELSKKIDLEECKNLSTCDILFTCNDEVCLSKHNGSTFKNEEFIITTKEKSVSSIEMSNCVIARPLVNFDLLLSKPEEILKEVEISAENLLLTAVENSKEETVMVLRKLASNLYDSLQVKELFLNVVANVVEEIKLRKQQSELTYEQYYQQYSAQYGTSEDNFKDFQKLIVDRLVAINEANEKFLESINMFNENTASINAYSEHLGNTVTQMKTIVDLFITDDSKLKNPQLWGNLLNANPLILNGPTEITFRLE